MTPPMPHENAEPVCLVPTAVADVRKVPLERLSEHSDEVLRRIVPAAGLAKVAVAAFDASL